jgi:hypothetical protein
MLSDNNPGLGVVVDIVSSRCLRQDSNNNNIIMIMVMIFYPRETEINNKNK